MTLRPMTMADAEKMLEWKNYPETRQFAIKTPDEVKLEDHLKWLEKNLQYFWTITDGNRNTHPLLYGAVRVVDGEISIWIDRQFWGQGIATWAIKQAARKGAYIAKIVEGNLGSMRAFIKSGYIPVEYVSKAALDGIYTSKELRDYYRRPNYYVFKRCTT